MERGRWQGLGGSHALYPGRKASRRVDPPWKAVSPNKLGHREGMAELSWAMRVQRRRAGQGRAGEGALQGLSEAGCHVGTASVSGVVGPQTQASVRSVCPRRTQITGTRIPRFVESVLRFSGCHFLSV